MKHRKTFRGAFQRKLTKFGDLITFDYVDNRRIAERTMAMTRLSSSSVIDIQECYNPIHLLERTLRQ